MSTELIPLSKIPYSARKIEAMARAEWPTRAMALDSASYRIEVAPGCYSSAYPPVVGWVLTRAAAEALAEIQTKMPGGTSHRRLAYSVDSWQTSEALGEYREAIARGVPQAQALAQYEAS